MRAAVPARPVSGPITVDSVLAAATLAAQDVGLAQMGDYLARQMIQPGN